MCDHRDIVWCGLVEEKNEKYILTEMGRLSFSAPKKSK